MDAGDPWRDPERQRWLLGLEAVFGVHSAFRAFLGYHLDPADPESVLDGPCHGLMSALSESADPLQALWRSDVRGVLFAESLGDAVAGLALAHARVLHECGGRVDAGTAWAWASAIEHGAGRVAGSVLRDFLFTAVRLALADPPRLLHDLVTGPATPPAAPSEPAGVPGVARDPGGEARRAVAGIRAELRHHIPPPESAPAVVRARSFDRQWRELVARRSSRGVAHRWSRVTAQAERSGPSRRRKT